MTIASLARKNIQQLTPYQSARRIGGKGNLWLNANESPFQNQYQFNGENLNRYPECQPPALLAAYAQYAGVAPDALLVTRGADEGIELLIRAFCEAEDQILFCPPTYGMYEISANIAGIGCKKVPLTPDWQLDLAQIRAALDKVKIVFLCSPNNPTANLIPLADIESVLESTQGRALVVVDEAYIDFCPAHSAAALLARYSHLVILRTLSKAFALAGLRCGFTLAHPEVIGVLQKMIAPYPIPVPVIDIACQSLNAASLARMKCQILTLQANRAYLHAGLNLCREITVFNSHSNYLLLQSPHANRLFYYLGEQGIVTRQTAIANSLRISIGTRDECEHVLNAIAQYLQSVCCGSNQLEAEYE